MESKKLFSVGDFAKLSRVSMAMLHHYDKIDLLSPITRGGNKYRYYSIGQLTEVNLIRTLQELGMSLREIKILKVTRTPENTATTLMLQLKKVDEKIKEWNSARELISTLYDTIISVKDVDERSMSISSLPEKPIVLGHQNSYALDEDGYDALVLFYEHVKEEYFDVDLNHPVWGYFSESKVRDKVVGKRNWPDRYYIYSSQGRDFRPAGLYAIGYARGGYGQNNELYARLTKYINENGYTIRGGAYEEYPQNETCISDDTKYLMRVMIPVRKSVSRTARKAVSID